MPGTVPLVIWIQQSFLKRFVQELVLLLCSSFLHTALHQNPRLGQEQCSCEKTGQSPHLQKRKGGQWNQHCNESCSRKNSADILMAKKWGLLYLAFYRQDSDLIVVEGSRIINDALQAGTGE
jgi:hypothetical protein